MQADKTQPNKLLNFLLRRRAIKEKSPYAGYSERMFAAAADLLFVMMVLRRPFEVVDGAISPYLNAEIAKNLLYETMRDTSYQGPFAQFQTFADIVFGSDIWVYVAMNHGIAAAMVVALLSVMQYYLHTTPGKWLMGLKLTKADLETRPGFLQLLLRYGVCVVSSACLMVGFLWVIFHKKHRAWHDIASGTYVLDTRPRGWYWQQIKRGFSWVTGKVRGVENKKTSGNEAVKKEEKS